MRLTNLKPLIFMLVAVLAGCATHKPEQDVRDVFSRQVLFTVTEAGQARGFSGGVESGNQQGLLVSNIIELHKLKKVAQWSVKALGIEAIVAEFGGDRKIEDVVAALQNDQRVESVQPVHTYDLMSYNDPYFHLQNLVAENDLEKVHQLATGKNVTVGVVDTGVDRQHPELAERIVYARNFVDHDQQDFDFDEHGTAVAGVIASAANNDLGIVGVAPDASMMIFKACSQNDLTRRSTCDSFSLMKALVDVLNQKPDILNLSLAGPEDKLLARLVQTALAQGIIVVAAVDSANPVNSFPASLRGVLAVNSTFQFEQGTMPINAVVAPGSEVLTTTPGATYAFRSGSSMSTAYVSGVAALMKEQNPALSAAGLITHLHRTSQGSVDHYPLVDVCQAIHVDQEGSVCTGSAMVVLNPVPQEFGTKR